MGTAGKKYAVVVVISLTIVLLLAATGAILDLSFGLMALVVLFALGWIVSILPDNMVRTKTLVIVFICLVSLCVFVVPALIQVLMPADVQKAWETSKIGSHTKLATWLYNPDARGGRNLEELCRAENYRLTNGSNGSEIGKTMKKIRELIQTHGADLEVLTDIRKPIKEMTLDQVMKMQDSTKPIDRYRALQQKLLIQRKNAVKEYARCMGKTYTNSGKDKSEKSDLNIEVDLGALRGKVSGLNLRDIAKQAVPLIYFIAGVSLVLAIMFAFMWFHKTSNFFWCMMVVCAFLATIIYIVERAL